MYDRILVPLDGSDLAEQAIPYASALAKALGSSITLMQAFESVPAQWADPEHGRYLDQITSSVRDQVLEYLERTAVALRDRGLKVECAPQEGNAADLIVDEAQRVGGTLIAMCTHGRSGINRWVVGSVTDKVLHATNAPMLIVRAKQGQSLSSVEINHVILPLDGSELAETAIPHAAALAKALDTGVTLMRTTSVPRYDTMDFPASMYDDLLQDIADEAQGYLDNISTQLSGQGITRIQTVVRQIEAASGILEEAGDSPFTLVAMSTHGHSGLGRWVLGSVTDRVVRQSAGPVLVIRDTQ